MSESFANPYKEKFERHRPSKETVAVKPKARYSNSNVPSTKTTCATGTKRKNSFKKHTIFKDLDSDSDSESTPESASKDSDYQPPKKQRKSS